MKSIILPIYNNKFVKTLVDYILLILFKVVIYLIIFILILYLLEFQLLVLVIDFI